MVVPEPRSVRTCMLPDDDAEEDTASSALKMAGNPIHSDEAFVALVRNSKSRTENSEIAVSENLIFADESQQIAAWTKKWKYHWASKLEMVLTPLIFAAVFQFYSCVFLQWNENRKDIQGYAPLSDPILPHIDAIDFSVPLFFCAYGSVLACLYYARHSPNLIMELFQTYFLVVCARMVALYLTPLEAPTNTLPLHDPLAHGDSDPLVRDLFFSGHTSTVFTAFFSCRSSSPVWKGSFLVVGILTASMVIFQKAHYVIDVYTAPVFVYACHRITYNIRSLCGAVDHHAPPKKSAKVHGMN